MKCHQLKKDRDTAVLYLIIIIQNILLDLQDL